MASTRVDISWEVDVDEDGFTFFFVVVDEQYIERRTKQNREANATGRECRQYRNKLIGPRPDRPTSKSTRNALI